MKALENAAALFKLLSHPSRLAILQLLREDEECVCHMSAALGLRQAYVSQQLMVLRQAGLVADRREGWNIYYRATKPEVYVLLDAAFAATEPVRAFRETPLILPKPAACSCPKCDAGSTSGAVGGRSIASGVC